MGVASRLPPRRITRRKRRRRRSTMRRSKPASLNLRSAETFLVGKLVLPSPPPARRVHPRRPTVHFHLWRISCCNKYDFYSWYGSNDSDGTINSKEHYFCLRPTLPCSLIPPRRFVTGASTCVTHAAASARHANNKIDSGNGNINLLKNQSNKICSL